VRRRRTEPERGRDPAEIEHRAHHDIAPRTGRLAGPAAMKLDRHLDDARSGASRADDPLALGKYAARDHGAVEELAARELDRARIAAGRSERAHELLVAPRDQAAVRRIDLALVRPHADHEVGACLRGGGHRHERRHRPLAIGAVEEYPGVPGLCIERADRGLDATVRSAMQYDDAGIARGDRVEDIAGGVA